MRAVDLIARKRDGGELPSDAIRWLVQGAAEGSVPDYQLAAWLMAVTIRGMSLAETAALTFAMRDSGRRLDLSTLGGPTVDKHSTGGVGDKTTLVVVPMLAALGLDVLKMSGRGLGFSGGTIDKLESIPGLRTELTTEEAIAQVRAVKAAIVGQSPELAPADKVLYALRDVTATVESIPLIAASIMSKKLACGPKCLVLDVKVGSGAFMKSLRSARALARTLLGLGREAGVTTRVVLSDMEEPLGRAVGNALEVREAIEVLTDPARAEPRFLRLCIALCVEALLAAGKCTTSGQAHTQARDAIRSGAAAQRLGLLIEAQGGNAEVVSNVALLPSAPHREVVRCSRSGYVAEIDAEAIGRAAVALGAGRARKEDPIDHAVGIVLLKKRGAQVRQGDPLAEVHLRRSDQAAEAAAAVQQAYRISSEPPRARRIVLDRMS